MSSKIEWTEETWNATTGCDRITAGCDNCYAMSMAKRLKGMGQAKYQNDGDPRTSGPGFKLTLHEDSLEIPLRWKKPRVVFVDSMSDLFHNDVPTDFILRVWEVMARTPQHTYQILTKRPQRMRSLVNRICWESWGTDHPRAYIDPGQPTVAGDPMLPEVFGEEPLPNVWLGTSIELDKYAFRADFLRETEAKVRFISAEPLLGPLPSLDLTAIDWLIVGGESGPGARPMNPRWVQELQEMCEYRKAECEQPEVPLPHSVAVPGGGRACSCEFLDPVAFFFKQAGAVLAKEWGMSDSKGHTLEELPRAWQVREMPSAR